MIEIRGRNYLTVQEMAARLELTSGRIYHFLGDGRLPSKSILGRKLVQVDVFEQFARTRKTTSGPKRRYPL